MMNNKVLEASYNNDNLTIKVACDNPEIEDLFSFLRNDLSSKGSISLVKPLAEPINREYDSMCNIYIGEDLYRSVGYVFISGSHFALTYHLDILADAGFDPITNTRTIKTKECSLA